VREDVGETQNGVVTDYTREVELFAICLNSDLRGKEETVDGIDHGDRGKSCWVSANVPTTLVIVVLTGVGYVLDHLLIKLISKVVDRVSIEFNISFLVDGLKPEFIEIARSSELLIL